jgi:hypothetical protein
LNTFCSLDIVFFGFQSEELRATIRELGGRAFNEAEAEAKEVRRSGRGGGEREKKKKLFADNVDFHVMHAFQTFTILISLLLHPCPQKQQVDALERKARRAELEAEGRI